MEDAPIWMSAHKAVPSVAFELIDNFDLPSSARISNRGDHPSRILITIAAFASGLRNASLVRLSAKNPGIYLRIHSFLYHALPPSADLPKPVKLSSLIRVLDRKPVEPVAISPAAPTVNLALRVLLAEDNPVNQRLALRLLDRWGCVVTLAHNGREAAECFVRDKFDVVLMDTQMPEMNGIEATRRIRQFEEGTARHVPVIAMTPHRGDRDHALILKAGADAFIAKPIRKQELRTAIARVVRRQPSVDEPVAPPATATTRWPHL